MNDGTPICSLLELQQSARLQKTVKGKPIVIFFVNGEVHAHAALCPHRGAPIIDAHLIEGSIVCSWHRSVFDLKDGACQSGPCFGSGARLEKYEAWIEKNHVLIRL